ncbi:replicative DNA helicase [Trichonephila clavata]|uniref:Replicative DNA helicase n=1 Tax=Trichonephila clavata TaxID=2740835 RepID=A0A8X6KFT2_TRICU|nr:replicative DNA helicase [Trichonephila clavata]
MNELASLLGSRSVDKEICKLPHNLEAEQMLIGAMIRDNRICDAVEDTITAENFYDPLHQSIFTQISKTRKHGIVANELSLKMFFENDQAFTECGGVEYLAKLAAKASIALDIYSLTRIIRDTYLRRCLIKLGQEIVGDSYNYDIENPAQAQIEQAMTKLFNLAVKKQGEKTYIKLASSIKDVVEKISTLKNNPEALGVTTGLQDLNQLLGGLQKSDLLILAARPSMGKTALALNIALNACKMLQKRADKQHYVAFFSLEMSAEQLTARLITIDSGISYYKALTGRISDFELHEFINTSTELSELPFIIDDTPALSISALRTRIRLLYQLYNVEVVFIDYLQLIRGTTKRSNENRVQEISEVTQGLKAIAKELNIPIVALSQLSRSVEQRDDKKPQLSDLRDSGSIEQDADIVMFLYREEYYELRKQPNEGNNKHREWQEKMEKIRNIAELIIAKQRNGPIGSVKLYFDSNRVRYTMKNIFNKTNAPYLAIGTLATLALLASGVFAVAPYVGFLAPVAALSVGLPFIIGGAIISAVVIALSSVAISKNKTVSQQEKFESRVAQRKWEEENGRAELEIPDIIELPYKDALDYLNIDNVPKQPDHLSIDAAKEHLMSLSKNQDIFYDAESGDEKDTEISSSENEPAKEENGQSWSAWSLDKAKTAAKLVVGGAMVAAAAAPILVSTLFTGSSASPAGDMFNSINGTCSRW